MKLNHIWFNPVTNIIQKTYLLWCVINKEKKEKKERKKEKKRETI